MQWQSKLLGALIALALLPASEAASQCASSAGIPPPEAAPHLWLHIQDGRHVSRIVGADTLGGDFAAVCWFFNTDEDSVRTRYAFTEARRNGERIRIADWSDERKITEMDAHSLSLLSRTVAFPLNEGDTLSFFRKLMWTNRYTGEWLSDNFRSPDTLTYAIELVSAVTGQRLALLDTLGVLAQIPAGVPRIHGTRPFIANVEYVVPASMAGQSAFMRVQHYDRGPGAYYTMRHETYAIGFRQMLSIPYWQELLHRYSGQIHTRRALGELNATSGDAARLTISPNPVIGEATICFGTASSDGPTSVVVYNASGERVFIPFTSPGGEEAGSLTYTFPSSGTYIVALMHQGRIVASQHVTVTK